MKLRTFRADLHIHSCLSPCGELRMSPRRIVERAVAEKLDVIAVTDHNTAENAGAVIRAGAGTGLVVLAGIEATSAEEVHILGLFPRLADALAFQKDYHRDFPAVDGNPFAEDQVVADEADVVVGFCRRTLMGASARGVHELVSLIHGRKGLALASHVDRPSFSLISQLGFVPPDLGIDGLEVSPLTTPAEFRAGSPECAAYPLVGFSDAHKPEDVGSRATEFLLAAPSLAEIRKALTGRGGRRVIEP